MSSVLSIPENQFIYPNPNQNIYFDFDNSIEEFRTSRYINNILKMFSPDAVLYGIDVNNITINDNNLHVNFNRGSLIQDITLIKIPYSFETILNNIQDNNNYFVVYTEFKYNPVTSVPTSDPQVFNIRVKEFSLIDDLFKTEISDWDVDKNRIVLHCAKISDYYNCLNEITINDNVYVVRSTIKNKHDFSYNQIESLNLDGGVIN